MQMKFLTLLSLAGALLAAQNLCAQPQPTPLTGTVLGYQTDASLFVAAVELKTTSGSVVVGFGPSVAKNLMESYPVGKPASLWAVAEGPKGAESWSLLGTGARQPGRWLSACWPSRCWRARAATHGA